MSAQLLKVVVLTSGASGQLWKLRNLRRKLPVACFILVSNRRVFCLIMQVGRLDTSHSGL